MSESKKKLLHRLMPLLSLGFFIAAVVFLYSKLSQHDPAKIFQAIRGVEPWQIVFCVLMTLGSYLMLMAYEWIGVVYAEKKLPLRRVCMAGFISYCFSHNLGSALLTGGSLRYRFYSSWGLRAGSVAKIITIGVVTFGAGFAALAAILFVTNDVNIPTPVGTVPRSLLSWVGAGLIVGLFFYLLACATWHEMFQVKGHMIKLPKFRLSLAQIGVAAMDLVFASTALYALLPPDAGVPWAQFVVIYLLALSVVVISQVPGGVGVLEATVLAAMPSVDEATLFGILVLYRMIYFIGPFSIAALMLLAFEIGQRGRLPADVAAEAEGPTSS